MTEKTTMSDEMKTVTSNLIAAGMPAHAVGMELLAHATIVLRDATGPRAAASMLRAAADQIERAKQ